MPTGGGSTKPTRGFGSFSQDDSASSLFDAAFSKQPTTRRRFPRFTTEDSEKDKVTLPSVVVPEVPSLSHPVNPAERKILSPPVSLPESTSTEGNVEQASPLSSDDETSQPSSSSNSASNFERKRSRLDDSPLNFDDESSSSQPQPLVPPAPKKSKSPSFEELTHTALDVEIEEKRKVVPKKEVKPSYRHSWTTGVDDVDEEVETDPTSSIPTPPASTSRVMTATRVPGRPCWKNPPPNDTLPEPFRKVRNVKEAHECLEIGEHEDFSHDLEYILSSLKDPTSSTNTKCLSTISLARKCITSDFRQFIRSKGMVNSVFRALSDAPSNPNFALCAAAVIYLMCRDFITMRMDATSLRLIANLLKIEKAPNTPTNEKFHKQVSDVFDSYLKRVESAGKKIQFDIVKDEISPSSLVLEALVYVVAKNQDDAVKTELLNLGAIQWIVAKFEKIVLRIGHEKLSEEGTMKQLVLLERCFRVLENCTLLHKKNQAFLVSHRGSVLIHSCARLLSIVKETVSQCEETSVLAEKMIACLALLARLLMNLSHENELCCTKLGQIAGFLPLCLASFSFLAPKYANKDHKFDLYVMMCALLVNMAEGCNSNRRKLIDCRIPVFNQETHQITEEPSVEALVQLFSYHEAAAKTIDEDLDKDILMEEPEDVEDEEEETRPDGRLNRGKIDDLSEAEMVMHVQSAMNKASAHMEDSVAASYVALLLGCLMQQNEDCVNRVRDCLPNGTLNPLLEQLQRFLEFMRLTSNRRGSCRSIERIVDNLERLNSE